MNYDQIIIRYGELSLKGKNRNQFVDKLRKSVQNALRDFPNVKIQGTRDRMYIHLNGENEKEIINRIRRIFGIQSISPAIKTDKELENLKEVALTFFKKIYTEGSTFKITAKRADKSYPVNSNELNQLFGAYFLKNVPQLKVDVKNPHINFHIEIRGDGAYLYYEVIPGAGGLPAGSSGKAMLMLSGGLDSPVAGYFSMKRGLEVEGVHFFSPPFTSERAKQKVIDLCEKLAEVRGEPFTLHIVPFTDIQQLIRKEIPEGYQMTTTRRLMLTITDRLREKRNGLAIVTGESLGQVASQTLESMYAINAVTSTPVIRPLVTMDKSEIIQVAKEIETYDISIQPFEDCCTIFVPAAPKTKPRKDKVEFFESKVDFTPLIEEAINNVETIQVAPYGKSKEDAFQDLF